MTCGHCQRQGAASAPFQHVADNVAAGIEAQQDAVRLIDRVRGNCGDGDELFYALRNQSDRSEAYRRAWLRRLQKALTA